MEEAADVIIVALATVVMTYPDKSPADIVVNLRNHMILKTNKYRSIMEGSNEL